jgi:hypothetical protein
LFNIPSDHVGVAFVDEDKEAFVLIDEQGLQAFYETLDQSSPEIKFVVQDLQTLDDDGECTFSSRYPALFSFPLPMSYTSDSMISSPPCVLHNLLSTYPYSSLIYQPQKTQSFQLGQCTPICLIYPQARVVSNQ